MSVPGNSLARKMARLEAMGFRRVDPPPSACETVPVARGRSKVTTSRPSMGTLVSITGIHESAALIQDATGLAFKEMARLVRLLNRYDSGSALSFLNAEGRMKRPPPELLRVVQEAGSHFHLSRGAFDATVQPLVDLFRAEAGAGRPSEARVQEVLARIDGSRVEASHSSIRLGRPGMGLTLDGIAKGFVVDRMAEILETQGLEHYLVEAGGDLRCAGFREDGEPWRVGVQDPQKEGNLPDVIGLSGGAVATSGSYEMYFDTDGRYHHLVSVGPQTPAEAPLGAGLERESGFLPQTPSGTGTERDCGFSLQTPSATGLGPERGFSPRTSLSVSVVAPTAMAADALATAVFVMGPPRGIPFIDSLRGCACLVVDIQGRPVQSRDWRSVNGPSTPGPNSDDHQPTAWMSRNG